MGDRLAERAKNIKIMAVASGGGHWVQLLRMRPAWDDCQVMYITTQEGYRSQLMQDADDRSQAKPELYVVTDANRWQKIRLLKQVLEIFYLVVKLRPDVVISTGAAPGFFALKFAKLLGARTIWVDSIANAEELSLSGDKVETSADLWLTQWEHLSRSNRDTAKAPDFKGSVV